MRRTVLIHPDELSERWIRRALDCGYTGIALHPVGGEKAAEALSDLLDKLKTASYRSLIDRAAEAGLTVEYELHAVGYLYPRERFDEFPQTFRQNREGIRTKDFNFCFSDSEAVAFVAERARELARQLYRSEPNYYFWADDARDSFCCCPRCAGMTPADQNLLLMNSVCAAIRKDVPNARVACLAYADTMEVPRTVRPAEGVFLEYAPFDRDMHLPISDQDRKHAGDVRALLDFFGREDAKVLDYWMDNSYFSKWTKPPKKYEPDREVMASDLRFYRDLGFRHVSSFACYLGDDYTALYGEPDLPPLE